VLLLFSPSSLWQCDVIKVLCGWNLILFYPAYRLPWFISVPPRDSTVSIATGYELGCLGIGILIPVGLRDRSLLHNRRLWGAPTFISSGHWRNFSRGIKRPGCDAHHCRG
jgi:hypothetical protein